MPFSAGNSVCGLSSCGWQWIVAVSGLLSRHHPIQQQKRQLILDHHFLRKGNFLHTSQKSSPYVFHGQNYSMCPCWVDFSVWLYESKCKSVSPWDKSGCVEGVCVHTSDRWIHIQQCLFPRTRAGTYPKACAGLPYSRNSYVHKYFLCMALTKNVTGADPSV